MLISCCLLPLVSGLAFQRTIAWGTGGRMSPSQPAKRATAMLPQARLVSLRSSVAGVTKNTSHEGRGNNRDSAASRTRSHRLDQDGAPDDAGRRLDAGARGSHLFVPITTPEKNQEPEDIAEDEVKEGPEHKQPGWPLPRPAQPSRSRWGK